MSLCSKACQPWGAAAPFSLAGWGGRPAVSYDERLLLHGWGVQAEGEHVVSDGPSLLGVHGIFRDGEAGARFCVCCQPETVRPVCLEGGTRVDVYT